MGHQTIETVFYPTLTQSVAVGSSSAAITNAVAAGIRTVRLYSAGDCYVDINKTPVATTSSMLLIGGKPEYFRIHPGMKVAALWNGFASTLFVTEMAH